MPAHVYGQLAKHAEGRRRLMTNMKHCIDAVISIVSEWTIDHHQPLQLKAALMSVGQLGSTNVAFSQLLPISIVAQLVHIAERAPLLSVRGMAFWAINLIGRSRAGNKR
jgi:hypothetical protein